MVIVDYFSIRIVGDKIFTIEKRSDEKFLRRKTANFDFGKFSKKEVNDLILKMKRAMREALGIGLSANQIGLDARVFVAEVPAPQDKPKFYAIFNPKIEKASKEKISLEEGCLSVPVTYGDVERAEKIVLVCQDKNGKRIKIKAWGLLACIFQHEVDHLDGKLFIDKATNVHTITNNDNNDKSR